MKKLFSLCAALFLAVTTVFADEEPVIATIGSTDYTDVASFSTAFGKIQDAVDIVLKADVDLGDEGQNYLYNMYPTSDITLDLNGHTLTGFINVLGKLTINDDSAEKTGKVKCYDSYTLLSVTNDSQNIIINGGTFEGGCIFCVYEQSASVTLNGGMFIPKAKYCFELKNNSKIKIGEGCEFRDNYFMTLSGEITSNVLLGGSVVPSTTPKTTYEKHTCNGVTYDYPVDCMEAFLSLLQIGGNGYLSQDMEVNIERTRYNELGESDVRLCLNGHMIYYSEVAAQSTYSYYIEIPNCNITIDDCNESTNRYWGCAYQGARWKISEETTDKVTTGGVINVRLEAKSIVFNGGNVVEGVLSSRNITINGGRMMGNSCSVYNAETVVMNGGVLEVPLYYGYFDNLTFRMTGGEIRNRRTSVASSNTPENLTAYLLGGKIVNNTLSYGELIAANHIVLGGSMVVSGNKTESGRDITLDNDAITVELSTEVPLTEGAHIGISKNEKSSYTPADGYPYLYPILSCDQQYAQYFFASNINERVVYDSNWNGLNVASRVTEQPSDENDYTFSVYLEDITPSNVSYQWYKVVTTSEEMTSDRYVYYDDYYGAEYKDGKWKTDSYYFEVYINWKTLIVTFPDGEPDDLGFSEFTSKEKLADGSYKFTTSGNGLEISADESFTCRVFVYDIQTFEQEDQTTNKLTAGEKDASYMCRVTIDGESIDSEEVTYTRVSIPSSVSDIQKETLSSKAVKRLENGRVVIVRDGERFDLAGRKIN